MSQRTLIAEEQEATPEQWLRAIEDVANAPTTRAGNAAGAELLLKAAVALRGHLGNDPPKSRKGR